MVGKAFPGVKSGVSQAGMSGVIIKPLPIIIAGQLELFGLKIRSYREPLQQAVRNVVIPSFKKNFEAEGRPAWTQLADQTLYEREWKGYPTAPILRMSKKGYNAATALARWKFTQDTAIMSAAFPPSAAYMPLHQIADTEDIYGGKDGTAYLPGRPFAMIQDEDQDKIEALILRWIKYRAIESGFHP